MKKLIENIGYFIKGILIFLALVFATFMGWLSVRGFPKKDDPDDMDSWIDKY